MPPEQGDFEIDNDMGELDVAEDLETGNLEIDGDPTGDDEALTDEHLDHDEDAELQEGDEDALDDGEAEPDPDFEEGDDVLVTTADGEQITIGELKAGYLRQKDYTHKTEETAREKESLVELRQNYVRDLQSLQTAYQNLTAFLEQLVPPMPDIALAKSDPAQYQLQRATHENAKAELQQVMTAKQAAHDQAQGAYEQDLNRYKSDQENLLVKAMPVLKQPGKRQAFQAVVEKTAGEFGFTEEEISSTLDHRILQLVHYARLGKIAERNRKNAGRRTAQKPQKGKRSKPAVARPSKSGEAMKSLAETGSIDDAVSALVG